MPSKTQPPSTPRASSSAPSGRRPLEIAARVLEIEAGALSRFQHQLLNEDSSVAVGFTAAIREFSTALDSGRRIVVTGLGKSGRIGLKISATLSSTGSPSIFLHATEALHGDLGGVQAGDCVLALSHTGNTEELLRLAPALKGLGTRIVGLGGNPRSQLAEACDAWIDASIELEACPHNLAPTSSTTLALAVGDAIAVTLMKLRGFEERDFARNHPGGALGRRLSLRVREIMHQGTALGRIGTDAPIEEILAEATRTGLGGVLVTESGRNGERLVGLITDGDFRRALAKKDRFFNLTAVDLMTQSPVTIGPDRLAREALELMENRPSQISVLPVVDDVGAPLGLVRLHDLVRLL